MDTARNAVRKIIAAHVEETVDELIQRMEGNNIRFLPILNDDGLIFGVISQSDLLKLDLKDRAVRAMKAWEFCTHNVHSIEKGKSLFEAAQLMVEFHIQHLVIMSAKRIVGIISASDLLSASEDASEILKRRFVDEYCR